MTDPKTVDNSVENSPPPAPVPSTSPAKAPVDSKGVSGGGTGKWAFPLDGQPTNGAKEVKGSYVAAPVHDIPKEVDPLLVQMLCWPRSHGSPEEIAFSAWLVDYLKNTLKQPIKIHAEGAFSVTIPTDKLLFGSADEYAKATTLFSCHLDTVDNKMTDSATRKKLTYDPAFGQIALDSQSAGNCLGADDSAGIWLMLKMIESKCPGTYLFHRGEECGGISAKAIARKEAAWLGQFSVAVAFDRKDTGDIVTVQGGQRCASGKFASRLGGMLDAFGFGYMESTTGSYTDVKEYRGVIAEVVNLSCGYEGAHSRNETLDYAHLAAMAAALPKVEWESLPVDRDPKAADPKPTYAKGTWAGTSGLFDDEDRQWGARSKAGKKTNGAKKQVAPVGKMERFDVPGFSGMSMEEINTVVEDDVSWTVESIIEMMRENAKLRADNDLLTRLLGL